MQSYTVRPIGYIRSVYLDKFGVPRQPGLISLVTGELVLEDRDEVRQSLVGLESFSHIWLQFIFHQVHPQQIQTKVRPPRKQGLKVGVWASRAPHRPNRLGLTLCRFQGIEIREREIALPLVGVDLVDGTPVVDVKPYVHYSDSVQDYRQGWLEGREFSTLKVTWSEQALDQLKTLKAPRELIEKTVELDPRPAHTRESKENYYLEIDGFGIRFSVSNQQAQIQSVEHP